MVAGEGQISVEIVGVDKFSQPMGQAGQSAQKMGQSASTAQSGVQKLDSSLGNSSKSATTAAGGYDKVATSTQKLGTATGAAEKTHRNYGAALAGVGTSIVGLATQVVSLGNTYDNLNDAQLRINKGATGIKVATNAVEKAERALNDTLNNEKSTTEDVEIAQANLANAKEKLTNKIDVQNNLIEDTRRAWQSFALQIAGTVMQSVGSLTTALGAMAPAGASAAKGFTTAGGGAKSFLKSVGPIAIAIAAAAAVFLAIKNNTLGFRDALNELGLKLGTAVPILKPLLEFLKQLGGFLGIAGDESATLKDKFLKNIIALKDQVIAGFTAIIDGAKAFVGNLLKAFDEFGKGNWAGGFQIIKDAFMNIINNETLQNFVKNIVAWVTNPSNWVAVGQGILQVFQGLISWTVNDVAPMVESFVTSIVDFVTDVNNWQKLWDGLVQAWTDMQDWATAIVDWIAPFFDELLKWFEDPKNWEKLWDALVKAWTDVETWWKDVATPWMEGIRKEIETWAGNQENWKTLGENLAKAIGEGVKFTADNVAPIITSFFTALKDNIIPTPEETDAMAKNIVTGISDAIQKVAGAIGKAIIEKIFGVEGTKSPEAVAATTQGAKDINDMTLDELIKQAESYESKKKIDDMMNSIRSYMAETWRTNVEGYSLIAKYIWEGLLLEMNKAVQQRGAEINAFVSGIGTAIKEGIPQIVPILTTAAQSTIDYLIKGFQGRYEQIKTEGGQMIAKLNEGLLNFASQISTGVQAVINWIDTSIKKAYANFLKWGGDVVAQIVSGITNAAQSVVDALLKPFTDFKAQVDKMFGEWDVMNKLKEALGTKGESQYGTPQVEEQGYRQQEGQITQVAQPLGNGQGMQQQQQLTWAQEFIAEIMALLEALKQFQATVYQVYNEIGSFLLTWTQSVIGGWTIGMANYLQQVADGFLTPLLTMFTTTFTQLADFLLYFTETIIGGWVIGLANYLQQVADGFLIPLLTMFTDTFTQIADLLLYWTETVIGGWTIGMTNYLTQIQEGFLLPLLTMFSDTLINIGEIILAFMTDVFLVWVEQMIELLTKSIDEGWIPWAEKVAEAMEIVFVGLAEYFDKAFTPVNDGIIEGLQTQMDAWVEWAEKVAEAMEIIFVGLAEYFDGVFTEVVKGTLEGLQEMSEAWMELADTVVSAIEEMVESMDDLVSGLEDVADAADDATKALEKMEQAAKDAAEAASKVGGGFRYGGSFLSGYQRGGSFISTREQTFKGKRISELDKWELVTVIPLSNPENARDKMSKLFNAPLSPTSQFNIPAMGMTGGLGGGGGNNVGIKRGGNTTVTGNIYATLILPDGRVIAQIANPYLMEGQDAEL